MKGRKKYSVEKCRKFEVSIFQKVLEMFTKIEYETEPVGPVIHFSYFANVFAKYTIKYEILAIHFSYFMQILCFINATKQITTKSFDFSRECVKCDEQKKEHETRKK